MGRFRLKGPTEYQIQSALFDWAALAAGSHPELRLLYAVPNGMHASSPKHVAMMKRAGLKPGVPDVCLPVPRGTFAALYVELKSEDGVVRAEQREWLLDLSGAGNAVAVARSFPEARELLLAYLAGRLGAESGPSPNS